MKVMFSRQKLGPLLKLQVLVSEMEKTPNLEGAVRV